MTAFSTRHENECAYCHRKFIAKVKRAMYCSPQCKHRALAKSPKKDLEAGVWHKVCTKCKSPFDSTVKNTRMCPSCAAESQKESERKWRKANPEWQKEWNKEHPDNIRKSKKKYNKNNPEKIKEQNKRRKRDPEKVAAWCKIYREKNPEKIRAKKKIYYKRKKDENTRKKAEEYQKKLENTAVITRSTGRFDPMEYKESIGIERITSTTCKCLRCQKTFILCSSVDNASRILKSRAATGKSPCPFCGEHPVGANPSSLGSQYEHEIAKIYSNFTEHNYRPEWMNGMEIDLYDPVARVGIEFHGLKWHSDYHRDGRTLHSDKADMAEKAGIQLIQVYESEWVQKKECVLDKLDAIFHRDMKRVQARKLSLRILDSRKDHAEASAFMDENHIQGTAPFQWGVALMDGNEMVAACFFRYGTGYASGGQTAGTAKYWELNRFATKLHVCVQGGLSRCISAFRKAHSEVHEIFSFADRRWTCPTRSAYSSSGFVEAGRQAPNYMYTDLHASHPLKNKQFMRKSNILKNYPEVYSEDKTEYQMASELGYYRIWDAGKIKYQIIF